MVRDRISRKLKKKIIKELGRDSYRDFMTDINFSFQKVILTKLGKDGWEYTDTGKYNLMYKLIGDERKIN